eukprot:GFYU01004415.1.p1 GENE.GFYU01004415.1~~GFYU01004415.1.p1  ORF type:complete len:284 (-),score=64.17 GFYU01004415.1:524-1375(-)
MRRWAVVAGAFTREPMVIVAQLNTAMYSQKAQQYGGIERSPTIEFFSKGTTEKFPTLYWGSLETEDIVTYINEMSETSRTVGGFLDQEVVGRVPRISRRWRAAVTADAVEEFLPFALKRIDELSEVRGEADNEHLIGTWRGFHRAGELYIGFNNTILGIDRALTVLGSRMSLVHVLPPEEIDRLTIKYCAMNRARRLAIFAEQALPKSTYIERRVRRRDEQEKIYRREDESDEDEDYDDESDEANRRQLHKVDAAMPVTQHEDEQWPPGHMSFLQEDRMRDEL